MENRDMLCQVWQLYIIIGVVVVLIGEIELVCARSRRVSDHDSASIVSWCWHTSQPIAQRTLNRLILAALISWVELGKR